MPLLDHFHPPLHGPRRWEGFHHSWAAFIAQQLNRDVLPEGYYAESEISLGPELEIDVATLELDSPTTRGSGVATSAAVWSPPKPQQAVAVDFSHLETYEVRVYQDLGGAQLRAAIELVSPANKDRAGSRLTFAAKCAGYLRLGVSLIVVDVVTSRAGNLHAELFETLEVKSRPPPGSRPRGCTRWPIARSPAENGRASKSGPRPSSWAALCRCCPSGCRSI